MIFLNCSLKNKIKNMLNFRTTDREKWFENIGFERFVGVLSSS